jgi:hypothetical protein
MIEDDSPNPDQQEPEGPWVEAWSDKQPKTNVRDLIMPAILLHDEPERSRIVELLNAGKWNIRRMTNNPEDEPETYTLNDDGTYVRDPEGDHLLVPMVQVYVEDGDEIIEICRFPITSMGRWVDLPDAPDQG